MIEYIRSFIDEISLQALQINLLIWVIGWLLYYLIFRYYKIANSNILKSKYNNDYLVFILFVISFIIIRYYMKIKFIEKYLNF